MQHTHYPLKRLLVAFLFLISAVSLSAQINPCNFNGGMLSNADGNRVNNVCLDDGDAPVDVVRTGFVGGESQYFITTTGGRILSVPAGGPPFDLSEFGTGILAIYSVAYSGDLFNIGIDDNICNSGATECFNLSNGIVVVRNAGDDCVEDCMAMAGQITLADGTGESTTICVDDGPSSAVAVTLSGDIVGENMTYLITSSDGEILGIPPGNGPFDLSGAGVGTCLIWYLAYDDGLEGLEVGLNADGLDGCFNLSNPITVNRIQGNDCFDPLEFASIINGVNEVPFPVTSTGNGMLSATLQGNALVLSGSFSDLTSDFDATVAGGAHLHLGFAGQAGPIAIRINATVDDDLRGGVFLEEDNTFELTTEQADAMRARGVYVNIHTLDYPAGEIRGQLVEAADSYARAYLLGVNEVPSIMSPALGGVVIERTGNEITLSGSFSGLTGAIATDIAGGAHIHTGVVGRNGPVIIPLDMDISDDMTSAIFPAETNTYTLTDEQADALDANGLYVNIHSATFRSGELRGQVTDASTSSFYADLSGHQARPAPINTDGSGRVQVNISGNQMTVFGSVADLSDDVLVSLAGGAHLHLGLAGESGPIAFEMSIDLDDSGNGGVWTPGANTFTLTDEQREALFDRGYYVNVHTPTVMSGEVRGQVMNLAKGYFGSNTNGLNAKPSAILTTGTGFLMYEMANDRFVATGSFQNLSSDFDPNVAGGSHIHVAPADRSGPIVFGLAVDAASDLRSGVYRASDNVFTLTEMNTTSLMAGNYYFNLHTVGNPSGEIRGQILRDDNAFPEAITIETPADGDAIVVSSGDSDLVGGTFTSADDPDGDLVVYSVEFTTPEDFPIPTTVLYTIGTDTTIARTFDAVYDTLISRGGFDGLQLDLRYRIFAGDGSVNTPDEYRSINITLDGGMDECDVDGGVLALADGGGDTITICAGDGVSDAFNVTLTDTVGTNFTYVITDGDSIILGLPADQPFDLEGAGGGNCLIWALSFEDDLGGAAVGMSALDLTGCFDLSNPITVIRNTGDECDDDVCSVSGGVLTFVGDNSAETTICAGDGVDDFLDLEVNSSFGDSMTFLITDASLNILGIPGTGPVNLEGAGEGTCLIWNLSYDGTVTGLAVGENAGNLGGCFSLSNFLTVNRLTGDDCDNEEDCEVAAGTITIDQPDGGDSITICALDDISDAFDVIVTDSSAPNHVFLITDPNNMILDLPASGPFDLDGAGNGICQLWNLSFEDGLEGLTIGGNVDDLMGCFEISNPITVTRLTGDDCTTGITPGDIVLNEVMADGMVEFTNVSSSVVDISNLSIVSTSGSARVGNMMLDCGDLLLKRGDIVVIDASGLFQNEADELRLVSAEGMLLSYAKWGAGAGANDAVGQALWDENAEFGALTTATSLQRLLGTESNEYQLATPTPCSANDAISGTGNAPAGISVNAYPNPFTGQLIIETEGLNADVTTLSVYDLTGRMLLTRTLTFRTGQLPVETAQLAAGTYVVRLTNEVGTSSLRVVKR